MMLRSYIVGGTIDNKHCGVSLGHYIVLGGVLTTHLVCSQQAHVYWAHKMCVELTHIFCVLYVAAFLPHTSFYSEGLSNLINIIIVMSTHICPSMNGE